ncbi:MAG: response regulator transcription factor [Clostridiales bacterium]|nr:response regulator transcription factor [Clostridiales bacterium]
MTKKENIDYVLKRVRGFVNEKYGDEDIEFFTARPDVLINYEIKDNYIYLFILDTVYKEVSGVDIALRLRSQHKEVYVLFITERLELLYPVINQNIMPSGFLRKPADENDLRKIISCVVDFYKEGSAKTIKTITVNTGSAVYKISHNEIVYIEALNKKIHIYTETNRISCYHSLQALENELKEGFVRCHKSYIINKGKIKNIYSAQMYVEMTDGNRIPISKTYKHNLRENPLKD